MKIVKQFSYTAQNIGHQILPMMMNGAFALNTIADGLSLVDASGSVDVHTLGLIATLATVGLHQGRGKAGSLRGVS